jgi:hypothetical protein
MLRNGLTRDESGKRTDKTGQRELVFNYWHRKFLSNKCYATDIDFYEYRIVKNNILPKAILECKRLHVKQKKYISSANTKALFILAKRAGIRFFIVLYEEACPIENEEDPPEFNFWVWEPKTIDDIDKYDERYFSEYFEKYTNEEFKELIENL